MKKSMMIVIASLVSMIFAEGISGVSYFRFSPGVTADGEDCMLFTWIEHI